MRKSKQTKKKNRFKFFLITAIILIGGLFFGKTYYEDALKAIDANNTDYIDVVIPASSSTNKIAQILKDKGIIKDSIVFNIAARREDVRNRLKAGEYQLSPSMNLDMILSRLIKGSKDTDIIRFTIPEGYEIRQIADKLSNDQIVDKDVFLNLVGDKAKFEDKFIFLKELERGQSLEGFLFPSTYEVYKDASEEEIIEKMLGQFEKIYNSEIEPKLKDFDFNLNQAITLASIIEREGKLDIERPMISAVFHNRLKENMKLQSCATVQYVLGERKKVLSNEDTRIDSPFNTYINNGLPPSPIASSGRESLIAAVNPADVEYLFFVLTGSDGSHTFTRTYEEHINAKQ